MFARAGGASAEPNSAIKSLLGVVAMFGRIGWQRPKEAYGLPPTPEHDMARRTAALYEALRAYFEQKDVITRKVYEGSTLEPSPSDLWVSLDIVQRGEALLIDTCGNAARYSLTYDGIDEARVTVCSFIKVDRPGTKLPPAAEFETALEEVRALAAKHGFCLEHENSSTISFYPN